MSKLKKSVHNNSNSNDDKLKNIWGGLNAIDTNKHEEERKEVLMMYVDYNKTLLQNKEKEKQNQLKQIKDQDLLNVQMNLEKFKNDMHNSSKIKRKQMEEIK